MWVWYGAGWLFIYCCSDCHGRVLQTYVGGLVKPLHEWSYVNGVLHHSYEYCCAEMKNKVAPELPSCECGQPVLPGLDQCERC